MNTAMSVKQPNLEIHTIRSINVDKCNQREIQQSTPASLKPDVLYMFVSSHGLFFFGKS